MTLKEKGARGEQVIEDLEEWAEGVNAAKSGLPHVGINQAIAGFAFIGSIFGNGGGGEVSNSNFLAKLEAKFGETEALKIFHDLRESNDPEAPTTTNVPFPYDKEPAGTPPAGAAVIEPNSLSPELVKANDAMKAQRKKMSNFLLVGSELTKERPPRRRDGSAAGLLTTRRSSSRRTCTLPDSTPRASWRRSPPTCSSAAARTSRGA